MKRNRILNAAVLALLAAVLASPTPSFGWGSTWAGASIEQVYNSLAWRIGLLRVSGALRFDNVGYDSNIYYGATANAVSDFTLRVGPAVRALLPVTQNIILDLSEFPQYAFYAKTKQERSWDNTFLGQAHIVFEKFYVRLGQGLSDTKNLLSTELSINVRNRTDAPSAFILWQLTAGTSVSLGYTKYRLRYVNPEVGGANVRQNLNRTENYGNLTLYLQQTSRARFFLEGEYGVVNFAEEVSQPKNTRTYTVYGGIDFLPAPPEMDQTLKAGQIQGRLNIGYKKFDIVDPTKKDFAGLVGDTGVAVNVIGLTALQGVFIRDVRYSAFSDYTYYLETTYGAGLASPLTSRIVVRYDFFIGRNDYPLPPIAEGLPEVKRIDRFTRHAFRANIRLRPNLTFSLFGSIGKRKSNLGLPSDRSFFGFNLIYGYEVEETPLVSTVTPRDYL